MKRTALVGLLALVNWSAQAAQNVPGWRIGAAASFGDFQGDAVPEASLENKFIEDNTVGAKLSVQYQFNNWLGLEGAYHNTGEFEERNSDLGKLELSVVGFSAQGLLYIPIPSDDFQIFGKAGYYLDFDEDLTINDGTTTSDSENGFVWGLGASILLTDHFGIRVDYDRFSNMDIGDLWTTNIGVEYYFGGPEAEPVAVPPPPPEPETVVEPPPPPEPVDSDGDGVIDDNDDCPDTPAGARVNARGCEEQLVLQGVTFENNSAQLTPNSTLTLDSVAQILKQRPNFRVEVRGHTDSSGSDEHNMDLSQLRAEAVRDYLVGAGVDADKLTANGYGETQPVADNDTAEGRAQNRRVALEFTAIN